MFGRRFDLERLGEARKPFFSSRLFGKHVTGAGDWSRAHTLTHMPEIELSKFELAPHPLDTESRKRRMEPTPEFKEKQIKAQRAVLQGAQGKIFKDVLAKTEAKELIEKIGDKVDEDYIHDFRNWIAGIGKRSDYIKAGVPLSSVGQAKPLSRDPTVINFIDKLTSRVIDYYAEIANMKMRGPGVGRRGGPATLNDLWLYFKYVVRNDPIDPKDFSEASKAAPDEDEVGNMEGITDSHAAAPSLADPPPPSPAAAPEAAKRKKPMDPKSRKSAKPSEVADHIAGTDGPPTTLPVTEFEPPAAPPEPTPAPAPVAADETAIIKKWLTEHYEPEVKKIRETATSMGYSAKEIEDALDLKRFEGQYTSKSADERIAAANAAIKHFEDLEREKLKEKEGREPPGKGPAEPTRTEPVVPAAAIPAPTPMDYSNPYELEERRKREEDAARKQAEKLEREKASMMVKAREEEEARKEREYEEAKRKFAEEESRRSAPPPEPTKATVTPEPAAVEPLKVETPPAAAAVVPEPEAVAIENVVKDTMARVNPTDAPPGFAATMKKTALKAMADWASSHKSSMMAKEEYEQRRLEAGVAATEAMAFGIKAVASGAGNAMEAASDFYHKTMKALEESHARKKEADVGIAEELVFGDGKRPVNRIADPSLARKIGLATAQYGKPLPSEGYFMSPTLYRLAKRAYEDVAGPENSSIDAKEFLSALAKRIPSLPSAPSLPSLPSLPSFSFPSISAPEISLPKFSLPSFGSGGSSSSAPEPSPAYDDSWKFIKLPEPAAVPPSPIPAAATPEPSMLHPPSPSPAPRFTPLMSQLAIGGRTPKIETPPARVMNTSPYQPLRAKAEPPAVPVENLVQSSRARAEKVAREMFARESVEFDREMESARELARELRESNESYLGELKKSNTESAARAQRQMEDLLARVDATLAPAEIAEAESIVVEDVPNSSREQRFIEHLSRKLTPPGFPAEYVKRALRVAIYEARSSREHIPLAQRIRQAVKVGVL